jgi:phage baseplate assembly protein V
MSSLSAAGRAAARLVRLCAIGVLKIIDDTGVQQASQAHIGSGGPAELEEIIDSVPRLGEYGLASCPPEGSEGVILFMGGRRSDGVVVATGHRASRPTDLEPGEAMLYNGLTGKWARLDKDGRLHANADTFIEAALHVTGDTTVDQTLTAQHVVPQDGATGSFVSQDGKHVTVTHGIITEIA